MASKWEIVDTDVNLIISWDTTQTGVFLMMSQATCDGMLSNPVRRSEKARLLRRRFMFVCRLENVFTNEIAHAFNPMIITAHISGGM